MSLFDYLLIAIAGLSMVLSLWRGFVREIISLIGLVAAFFAASRASGMAANLVHGWIPNTTVANIAGFTLVFVAVMVVVALVGALIRRLVDMADLTATDRTLGMFFGLARGLLLIGLFFLIYTSYAKPDKPWMKKSMLAPYAIEMGDFLGKAIPEGYPFSRQGGGKPNVPKIPAISIPDKDKEAVKSIIRKSMQ
ncbi:MAG: CvpA family protein [Mariprofundaceae bacterium]|nr:CvpA family protein [Mariprofundaceae bacterium]